MYEKCVKCPKVGISCEGPHFFTMSAAGLLEWCKERKKFLKISNEKLAELSGIPKGTIDRLFSGEHLDFKFETIRPIIKVLAGGEWIEAPCPDEPDNFSDEKIAKLDEKITNLEEENQKLKDRLAEEKENSSFIKEQFKYRGKAIVTLTSFLGIAVAVIIAALIIDLLHHDFGFFWVA